MKFSSVLLTVFSALTFLSAQTIDFNGKITSCSGNPIEGATITLDPERATATTNASGTHEISYTVAAGDALTSEYQLFSLVDRELKIFLSSPVSVSVEFHNVKGKLVQDFQYLTLDGGQHHLTLPKLNKAGLYIMTLNIGSLRDSHRVLSSPTGSLTLIQSNQSESFQNNNELSNLLAKKPAATDALEISAGGYKPPTVPADELTTTVDVVLSTNKEFDDGGGKCPVSEIKFVHFSVGSGDATLIIFPTGKTMMIDSGTERKASERIVPFLLRHDITHLDYYVDSHPHDDHDGGRGPLTNADILNNGTHIYNELDAWLNEWNYEDSFELEGTDWFIYNVRDKDFHGSDANPNSLSVRIDFNGFIYSGTGDEGPGSQNRFLADHPNLVEAHLRYTAHHLWTDPSFVPAFATATNAYLYVVSNDWLTDSEFKSQLNKLKNTVQNNPRENEIAVTGEIGHVIVRASGPDPDQWSYEFCKNYNSCIIPNFP